MFFPAFPTQVMQAVGVPSRNMPERCGISTQLVAPPAPREEGIIKILLVDDDERTCLALGTLLKEEGFDITTSTSVTDALRLLNSKFFDVLLSDLHMPDMGDGLTVVSAMRHANPKAVTIILSAFPEMNSAAQAILLQADQILIKSMDTTTLVTAIRQRLANEPILARTVESVATILERSIPTTIRGWYKRVEGLKSLTVVAMSRLRRTEHLPRILMNVVDRLRCYEPLGSTAFKSAVAQQ